MKAIVTNIQRFSIHDGPGIRTVVFLKGCPLNCKWCHNPENIKNSRQIQYNSLRCIKCNACVSVCQQNCHNNTEDGVHIFNSKNCIKCLKCADVCLPKAIEICGIEMTTDEIVENVLKDKVFYGDDGGITLSGGEPMLFPDFTIELLKQSKQFELSTCIETCGYFLPKYINDLGDACDTILWDIKDTDYQRHMQNTGADLSIIMNNLVEISKLHKKKIIIRCIIIKGINDNLIHISKVIELAKQLGISQINLLPFHPFGNSKYNALGYSDLQMGKEFIPSHEIMSELKTCVERYL